jgi:hypothetical protein
MLIASSSLLILSLLVSAIMSYYTNSSSTTLPLPQQLSLRVISFLIYSITECACMIMWVLMVHPVIVIGTQNYKINFSKSKSSQNSNTASQNPHGSVDQNFPTNNNNTQLTSQASEGDVDLQGNNTTTTRVVVR